MFALILLVEIKIEVNNRSCGSVISFQIFVCLSKHRHLLFTIQVQSFFLSSENWKLKSLLTRS